MDFNNWKHILGHGFEEVGGEWNYLSSLHCVLSVHFFFHLVHLQEGGRVEVAGKFKLSAVIVFIILFIFRNLHFSSQSTQTTKTTWLKVCLLTKSILPLPLGLWDMATL